MDIALHDGTWELMGFWPWVPLKGTSMEIGNELMGITEWIPASVPGGVHQDLFRAGLIANPYQDMNSLQCEWIENRWWVYRTRFATPHEQGDSIELILKGLDYEAIIYLNKNCLGEHKGMYHPAVFEVGHLLSNVDSNELIIVLKQAPDEMGQIGKTSETFTQKSRFNYKWDFSTRLVNVGIWDEVVLRVHQVCSFDGVSLQTDVQGDMGMISISTSIRHLVKAQKDLILLMQIYDPCGELLHTKQEVVVGGHLDAAFHIDTPKLWYPNGYGDQPLYEVVIQLLDGDRHLDRRVYRTGLRSLAFERNDSSPVDCLPYTFVINGKKIYIKGVNITPLDHAYGNVTRKRYDWMVYLAKRANINMIRIWGGGLIEKEYLYSLCDRHGILIWQEFIQSSSGIDNIPSKRPEFLDLLYMTATQALVDRRNHVSLTVWSGGNELMSAPNTPCSEKDSNLFMLKGLVEILDPQRLFLPTSASGPVQYITEVKGISHDVHGHWKYQGNPGHYRVYSETDSLFHSEFGVDGLSCIKSLRKFLSEEHLVPTSMRDNMVWRHHGEWWDTYDRDTELFGLFERLEDFVDASQWIQAEGLRYILEANQRRKFNNSGSIIWQLNEPWPNVSCTNLIDYYYEPKMAYYWASMTFSTIHASLQYTKLDYEEGEVFQANVFLHCNADTEHCRVSVELLDSIGMVFAQWDFTGIGYSNHSTKLGLLAFEVPMTEKHVFFIRMRVESSSFVSPYHTYTFSTCNGPLLQPALTILGAELLVDSLGPWLTDQESGYIHTRYRVTNTGTEVALTVYPQEISDQYWMVADNSYFNLFPGEDIIVTVTCTPKSNLLFDRPDPRWGQLDQPEITFYMFANLN